MNDSLYEWNVKILTVDPESPLAEDLKKLKDREGKDHILLSFIFKVSCNGIESTQLFPFGNSTHHIGLTFQVPSLSSTGHVSLRPTLRAHGPSRAARRLRAGRRCAVHGTDDAAGVVVRLHDGGCDHAAVGHARQRQSQNQVRRAKGQGASCGTFKIAHLHMYMY